MSGVYDACTADIPGPWVRSVRKTGHLYINSIKVHKISMFNNPKMLGKNLQTKFIQRDDSKYKHATNQ